MITEAARGANRKMIKREKMMDQLKTPGIISNILLMFLSFIYA